MITKVIYYLGGKKLEPLSNFSGLGLDRKSETTVA